MMTRPAGTLQESQTSQKTIVMVPALIKGSAMPGEPQHGLTTPLPQAGGTSLQSGSQFPPLLVGATVSGVSANGVATGVSKEALLSNLSCRYRVKRWRCGSKWAIEHQHVQVRLSRSGRQCPPAWSHFRIESTSS